MEENSTKQKESLQELHPQNATQQNLDASSVKLKEQRSFHPYRIRTFNDVSLQTKNLPPAVKLFGDLIYRNEITILAGDTGVGKSILAVDIALKLSSGNKGIDPFLNEATALKTMYFDYELTDVQFYKRFPLENYPKDLYRVDGNPDCIGCGIGLNEITELIRSNKPDVVILDNLSALIMDSGKDADIAIGVMKEFKMLQKEFGTTIIVLSHIPKRYENAPLRIDNVAGSKYLANFADSILFIAKSVKDKNLRYLKHVKGRNSEIPEEVYTIQLVSGEGGLTYNFIEMSSEKEHLFDYTVSPSTEDRLEKMKQMKLEGKTYEEIGAFFGINKSNVSRALKNS